MPFAFHSCRLVPIRVPFFFTEERCMFRLCLALAIGLNAAPLVAAEPFDVLIKNGTVYDGSGLEGVKLNIGVRGDKIAAIGGLKDAGAKIVIDAQGQAVAPGFINMLSWGTFSLLEDGRSQSDIRQGVTLEVFGEGWSMGP